METWETEVKPERSDIEEFRAENKRAEEMYKIHRIENNLAIIITFIILLTGCNDTTLNYRQPNIIFLLTDDQRDNTLGIMEHPILQTPNLDWLVKQGIRFSKCYIAEPVCSFSRVSLLTGVHERIHGVGFSSSYELTEEQWEHSYPELLRKNGYFIPCTGNNIRYFVPCIGKYI